MLQEIETVKYRSIKNGKKCAVYNAPNHNKVISVLLLHIANNWNSNGYIMHDYKFEG